MRRIGSLVVGVLLMLTIAACGSQEEGAPQPTDTAVTAKIRVNTGSIPPPHNHSWTVDITGSTATLTWSTNYVDPDDKVWTATADIDPARWETFLSGVDQLGLPALSAPDEMTVGGGTGSFTLRDGADRNLSAQLEGANLSAIGELTFALLPELGDLQADYRAWEEENQD